MDLFCWPFHRFASYDPLCSRQFCLQRENSNCLPTPYRSKSESTSPRLLSIRYVHKRAAFLIRLFSVLRYGTRRYRAASCLFLAEHALQPDQKCGPGGDHSVVGTKLRHRHLLSYYADLSAHYQVGDRLRVLPNRNDISELFSTLLSGAYKEMVLCVLRKGKVSQSRQMVE